MKNLICLIAIVFIFSLSSSLFAQNVGININNPRAGLDILSFDSDIARFQNKNNTFLLGLNEIGNLGLNIVPESKNTFVIKPGLGTVGADEILAIRSGSNATILSVEEQGRVGILSNSPLTKFHVQGGLGNTGFGDMTIGDTENSIRFGMYTGGGSKGWGHIWVNGNGVRQLKVGAGSGFMNFDGINGRIGIGSIEVPGAYVHVRQFNSYDFKLESKNSDVDLILDGAAGNSTIEFQNDGAFQGSFGYDNTQDRLFLYSGGNVMYAKDGDFYFPHLADTDNPALHVSADGKVVTEKEVYDTWSLDATSFLNQRSSDSPNGTYYSGGIAQGNPDGRNMIISPVNLPQGAHLKSILLNYKDEQANDNIRFVLEYKAHDASYTPSLVDYWTSGSSTSLQSTKRFVNHIVDNTKYSYSLLVWPAIGWRDANGNDMGVWSVVISEDPDL